MAQKIKQEEIKGGGGFLTPADQNVSPEVFPLGEERHGQQRVKIKTLHQEPEETGHNTVLEEHNHRFAADLTVDTKETIYSFHISQPLYLTYQTRSGEKFTQDV